MARIFIGMESSGTTRRQFASLGHTAISCDLLRADDGAIWPPNHYSSGHIAGDVFATVEWLNANNWRPDLAIFHPTCTLHTVSAAWAFNDPDYERYPHIGYHQKIGPDTLVGKARREARELAEKDLERIRLLPFLKAVENPRGTISTRLKTWGKPCDVLQPYEFGDNASKATCIWVFNAQGEKVPFTFLRDPKARIAGRFVNGVERWDNQTDTGQNRLGPSEERWKDRSKTYPGIASAFNQLLSLI
jgi:hypothetical protein